MKSSSSSNEWNLIADFELLEYLFDSDAIYADIGNSVWSTLINFDWINLNNPPIVLNVNYQIKFENGGTEIYLKIASTDSGVNKITNDGTIICRFNHTQGSDTEGEIENVATNKIQVSIDSDAGALYFIKNLTIVDTINYEGYQYK